jgi:hypothetical protein
MMTNKKNDSDALPSSKGKKKRNDVKPTFIISTSHRETMKSISEAQKIQLDIIAKTNFNFFEGRKVAELLKENHRMWRAVLMPLDLISLRDMDEAGGMQTHFIFTLRMAMNSSWKNWLQSSSRPMKSNELVVPRQ